MKACVVGVGAVGGVVAEALVRAGTSEVSALARGRTLEVLRRDGLTVHQQNGDSGKVALHLSDEPAKLGRQDVLFLATKAQALPVLAPSLAPLVGPDTAIVPLINGVPWWFFAHFGGSARGMIVHAVDPDGVVSHHLPPDQVVGAVVHFSSTNPQAGIVQRGMGNRIIIGDPGGSGRDTSVAALLRGAGFEIDPTDAIHQDVWFKLWGNGSFNPVSALTRATIDRIAHDADTRALCIAMMYEAAAVSERFGLTIPVSPEDRIAVTEKLGGFKTSMLQDAEAGRELEIAPMLGAVAEIATVLDVPIPFTRAVLGMTRLLSGSLSGAVQPG